MSNTPKPQANRLDEILSWASEAAREWKTIRMGIDPICHHEYASEIFDKHREEATQAITQAMLDALPEKHEVDPIGNADYRYCMGRNNAIEEMESAIKKMGGSDV